uniref:MATH domain-containing protein n=2 Tax=Aegilops tauschii subsp. strangulata TaxID=200361 RepID=A0A453D083_AEGTS
PFAFDSSPALVEFAMGNINSCWATHSQPPVSVTSSVCTTEATTAVHKFVVKNYSLLDGMGADKYVTSSKFRVGGYDWWIDLCPDGNSRAPGYVAAFLHLLGEAPPAGVTAKFTLSLLKQDGKVHRDSSPLIITRTFETKGSGWGNLMIIKKSKLRGDCFTIRCDLTVIETPIVQEMLPN